MLTSDIVYSLLHHVAIIIRSRNTTLVELYLRVLQRWNDGSRNDVMRTQKEDLSLSIRPDCYSLNSLCVLNDCVSSRATLCISAYDT